MKGVLFAIMLLLGASSTSPLVAQVGFSGWTIAFSPGPPQMRESSGSYYFDFPSSDGVHHVTVAPSVQLTQTVTMRFAIAGNGRLAPTEGKTPARVRLFLEKRSDRMTASEPYKRWWSVAYVDLIGHREFRLTAQLVPAQWSNVFGKNGAAAPNEFERCVKELDKISFTFGGMFAAHGVYVTGGAARFILRSYTVAGDLGHTQPGNFSWAGLPDPVQLWLQSRTRKDNSRLF